MNRAEIIARVVRLRGQAMTMGDRAAAFADQHAVPALGETGRAIAERAALRSFGSQLAAELMALADDLRRPARRRRAA